MSIFEIVQLLIIVCGIIASWYSLKSEVKIINERTNHMSDDIKWLKEQLGKLWDKVMDSTPKRR